MAVHQFMQNVRVKNSTNISTIASFRNHIHKNGYGESHIVFSRKNVFHLNFLKSDSIMNEKGVNEGLMKRRKFSLPTFQSKKVLFLLKNSCKILPKNTCKTKTNFWLILLKALDRGNRWICDFSSFSAHLEFSGFIRKSVLYPGNLCEA